jgi:putative spermidine/putrescine transport system permease protein
MTIALSGISTSPVQDTLLIRRQLRRIRLRSQMVALLLIAPLFLFLMLSFVAPIALLLVRGVDNGEVARILPRTATALGGWQGAAAPDESAFAALAADLKAAPREAVAEAARRLNYQEPGLRSVLLKSARQAPRLAAPPYREQLIAIDDSWAETRNWQALKQAMPATTDFFLLASLDLRRGVDGAIERTTPDNAVHVEVLVRTFVVSVSVTLVCLLLGYPLAAMIARAPGALGNLLLILVLLPFWTSLLVRTTAWVVLLQGRGVINSGLIWLGLLQPDQPLELIYNRIGVLIAMTHILLPFMVLPIYSVMKAIPPVYLRAASSLGAPPLSAFWRVYLPMSLPGVSAGCLLVFILALGYYITPALVGGPRDQMISYFIAYYANQVTNWGMAAALSGILLVAVLILYAVYNKLVGVDRLRIG